MGNSRPLIGLARPWSHRPGTICPIADEAVEILQLEVSSSLYWIIWTQLSSSLLHIDGCKYVLCSSVLYVLWYLKRSRGDAPRRLGWRVPCSAVLDCVCQSRLPDPEESASFSSVPNYLSRLSCRIFRSSTWRDVCPRLHHSPKLIELQGQSDQSLLDLCCR